MYFDETEWKKYNPAMHFQNRGRHSDYLTLFKEVGFEVIMEKAIEGPWSKYSLDASGLSHQFRGRTQADLRATAGLFVLRNL
jgi:hypothetical protein